MVQAYGDAIIVRSDTAPYRKHVDKEITESEELRECCKAALCENDYTDRRVIKGVILSAGTHKDYEQLVPGDTVYYIAYAARNFPAVSEDAYIINYCDIYAVEKFNTYA